MKVLDVLGKEYPCLVMVESEDELLNLYHALNMSTNEYRAIRGSSLSSCKMPADVDMFPMWNEIDEACIRRGLRNKEYVYE